MSEERPPGVPEWLWLFTEWQWARRWIGGKWVRVAFGGIVEWTQSPASAETCGLGFTLRHEEWPALHLFSDPPWLFAPLTLLPSLRRWLGGYWQRSHPCSIARHRRYPTSAVGTWWSRLVTPWRRLCDGATGEHANEVHVIGSDGTVTKPFCRGRRSYCSEEGQWRIDEWEDYP